ncbi:MAG: cytidylate kinase family protein [Saprospiraceae bacterium]|nr:cytidylate kinase family protein [Saprospiraceae bacterium]MDW8484403.1 cytidylate kinase family protein [Saprospiraceae bacterium]
MQYLFPPSTKITITGDLGSGKSAVARRLCELTGFEYFSTGRLQRQLAEELGVDTLTLNRLAEIDPTIDYRIDEAIKALGQSPGQYVVDSRLAWFFIPNSYKVYLTVEARTAAERIFGDLTRRGEQYQSIEEAMEKIAARKASENARYLRLYGADCENMANFDLVLDTTHRTVEEVCERILLSLSAALHLSEV